MPAPDQLCAWLPGFGVAPAPRYELGTRPNSTPFLDALSRTVQRRKAFDPDAVVAPGGSKV